MELELLRGCTYELRLGDLTLQLVFDMNALAALEAHGQTTDNLATGEVPPFSLLRLLVWAGARTHHPELTLEEVGARILPTDVPRVNEVVERAIRHAFGQEEGEERPKGEGEGGA